MVPSYFTCCQDRNYLPQSSFNQVLSFNSSEEKISPIIIKMMIYNFDNLNFLWGGHQWTEETSYLCHWDKDVIQEPGCQHWGGTGALWSQGRNAYASPLSEKSCFLKHMFHNYYPLFCIPYSWCQHKNYPLPPTAKIQFGNFTSNHLPGDNFSGRAALLKRQEMAHIAINISNSSEPVRWGWTWSILLNALLTMPFLWLYYL